MSRRGTRADMSPVVVRKAPVKREPTICKRCGAVYLRRTWRRRRTISHEALTGAAWSVCPACKQVEAQEYTGRVLLSGTYAGANLDAIRERVENVARRAGHTQPERKLVSADWSASPPELLTTSQKLAHRLVHEIRKTFGGRAKYQWADDGLLLATWHRDLPRPARRRAQGRGKAPRR